MTTTIADDSASRIVEFRDARWKSRWVVIGLIFLLGFRSIAFIDRTWLTQLPAWLVLVASGLALHAFLLIYPIVTCDPTRRPKFAFPAPVRWLVEFGIAIPVVMATVVTLGAANYLVGRLSPGASLTPGFVTNMAKSPDRMLVSLLLLVAVAFAPIAEEVFFRGFLHHAFRARMPLIVAILMQSLAFGFAHSFGVTHASVAFVLGLMLTLVYQWRKTLIAPILAHAGINLIAALGTVLMMVVHANSPVLGVIGDPQDTECVIREIANHSAAEEAGLQMGDVITSFNREPIRDFPHLVETVQRYRPGDIIALTIKRPGSELEVNVVLRRHGDP